MQRKTSHVPSSLSLIVETASPTPTSSGPETTSGTKSADRSVDPVIGSNASSAARSMASIVAASRAPCKTTANDAANGPRHCAPGVDVGQPTWPGRSGRSFLDNCPTERTNVIETLPSSPVSYSANPSLITDAPREPENSDTYRWSGAVGGTYSLTVSSGLAMMRLRMIGPNAASAQ